MKRALLRAQLDTEQNDRERRRSQPTRWDCALPGADAEALCFSALPPTTAGGPLGHLLFVADSSAVVSEGTQLFCPTTAVLYGSPMHQERSRDVDRVGQTIASPWIRLNVVRVTRPRGVVGGDRLRLGRMVLAQGLVAVAKVIPKENEGQETIVVPTIHRVGTRAWRAQDDAFWNLDGLPLVPFCLALTQCCPMALLTAAFRDEFVAALRLALLRAGVDIDTLAPPDAEPWDPCRDAALANDAALHNRTFITPLTKGLVHWVISNGRSQHATVFPIPSFPLVQDASPGGVRVQFPQQSVNQLINAESLKTGVHITLPESADAYPYTLWVSLGTFGWAFDVITRDHMTTVSQWLPRATLRLLVRPSADTVATGNVENHSLVADVPKLLREAGVRVTYIQALKLSQLVVDAALTPEDKKIMARCTPEARLEATGFCCLSTTRRSHIDFNTKVEYYVLPRDPTRPLGDSPEMDILYAVGRMDGDMADAADEPGGTMG